MTVRVMGHSFAVTSIQFTGTDSATVYYLDDAIPGRPLIRWVQMSLHEFYGSVTPMAPSCPTTGPDLDTHQGREMAICLLLDHVETQEELVFFEQLIADAKKE